MWHWTSPKLFPAAGKAEKVKCCEREWVCLHPCGKEGWSPREIGLHQFLLITQSFCYVALLAKSVEGSHMVKGKKKRNKNTLVLLNTAQAFLSNAAEMSATVSTKAQSLQGPVLYDCLHLPAWFPEAHACMAVVGSHLRRCSHRDSLTSSARTKSPISDPVPPPAAPRTME